MSFLTQTPIPNHVANIFAPLPHTTTQYSYHAHLSSARIVSDRRKHSYHGGFDAPGVSCHAGKQATSFCRISIFGGPACTTDNSSHSKAALPPAQAVSTLNERVKRIGRVNSEIADWLQVRTRPPHRCRHDPYSHGWL